MTSASSLPVLQPIDAELAAFMRQAQALEAACATPGMTPAERRRELGERVAAAMPPAEAGVARHDVWVPAAGREIAVRLYRAEGADAPRGLMPYFHGGGWAVGSIATHDRLCAALARDTGYLVASVHYRRSPEHPYPAPHDDCWAAIGWLRERAGCWGVAGAAPLVLGGDSAGAHLALGCAMRALEEGGPAIDRMLLFYPPVRPDADTPSMREHADGPGLTARTMREFWDGFAGPAGAHAGDPRVCLDAWPRMAELPSSVVVSAGWDVLRDECEALAASMAASGARAVLLRAPDMAHGFARMLTTSRAARDHVRRACESLLAL